MQRRAVGGSSGVAGVERAATGCCRRRRCKGAAQACCHRRRCRQRHRRGAGSHITRGEATRGPTVTCSSSGSSCPRGQRHPLPSASAITTLQGRTVPLLPQGRIQLRALAPAAGTQARGGAPRPLLRWLLPLAVLEPVSERADEACRVHRDMLCGGHTCRPRF